MNSTIVALPDATVSAVQRVVRVFKSASTATRAFCFCVAVCALALLMPHTPFNLIRLSYLHRFGGVVFFSIAVGALILETHGLRYLERRSCVAQTVLQSSGESL